MPLFTSASGVQINGGTFIDTAGDMNIVHPPQLMPAQNIGALEFVAEGPSRELSGVERNDRGFGAARMQPYDVSRRLQIPNRTQSSSLHVANADPFVSPSPSFSNSGPSTFPPQEHEFNSQHLLGSLSTTSSSQDFTAGYHELFHDSMNSTGSEHPMFSFAPVARDFSQISSSDNQFGLASTGHVPNPLFSTQIFSEETQPQFTPSYPLPTTVDVSNFGPVTRPFGEPAPPIIGSVAGTNHQPWDAQPQEQRVINGGTFIGGNLNYIHTTVVPPSISADQTARQTNNCPLPSRIFHGRQAILDKMHEFFNQDIGKQHIYVLHGLGGAGKTQIGLKFVNNSSHFTERFFLDGSTAETIDTGLKNIASMKNVGNSSQDALRWLADKEEDWLMFYDNTDDPKLNLNSFLPQCTHGNIIITTRNPGLCVYAGAQSAVSDIEEGDGLVLLLKSAAQDITPANERMAAEIVKELCYLPLAIVQAGAFISQSGTLNSYLDIYRKNRAQLLSEQPAQSHDNYAQTVYTTWQMSFDCLSPPAAMFLQLCSFLHWDGITEEIFSRAATYKFSFSGPSRAVLQKPLEFLAHFTDPAGEWDTLYFLKVTNEIKAYSLMTEGKMFSIHPLVHSWSRTILTDQQSYHSIMAAIMGMSIYEIPDHQRQLISLKLISHIDSLRHGNQQVVVDFGARYGSIYWEAGWYEEAKELRLTVLEQRKHVQGDDHPDTLRAMGCLASTYRSLGKYNKAEVLEVVVLAKQKQVLGDDHPDTLRAMGRLASTHWHLGKFHQAEELEVVVLEKQKQVLGDDHPDTLLAMGNLASTYHNLGEFHKAEELEVVVLEKQKHILGDGHPDTLWTMGILALTYLCLGKVHKAEELAVIVLEKRKHVLGDDHPDTLLTMGNLGWTYHQLGQFQEAEKLGVIVLEKRKKVLGVNHPYTLWSVQKLALTYHSLGKLSEAEELETFVRDHEKALKASANE
ncbi:hypothetical protein B0H13DRAFT_2401407, partial [Mycena leptocephala]